MQRRLLVLTILAVCLGLAAPSSAQVTRGFVREGLTLESKALGKPVRYTVYLPFDYETSDRYYPVLYLLHGYGDNDMGWVQFGEANLIADEAIAGREAPPMIIVMPDGGVSFYINSADGKTPYEDFFIQEFIPQIEKTYRIRSEKRYRAIAGLSMGGYGALMGGMRHPELFSSVVALSAAVLSEEEVVGMSAESWNRVWGPLTGPGLTGQARLSSHFRAHSAIDIVKADAEKKLNAVRFYIDCGDDDFLTVGNAMLHAAMTQREIKHEYRVRDGAHTWSYWRTGLPDALRFVGTVFHQP